MILRGLEGIARRGTWLMAASLVAGYALPGIAALFRPVLLWTILAILTVAMLRLDVGRLRSYARRPATIAAIVAVNLIAAPLLLWAALQPFAVPSGIAQGLVLMAAAPMLSSAIAFATILELDAALAVSVMVASYAVVPFSLPALALWLIGLDLGVGAADLFLRLFATIAAPAALAFVLRRWIFPPAVLVRNARAIDGIGVLAVVAFGFGIMAGLPAYVDARPAVALAILGAAFAANIALQIFGALLFLKMGRREALTVGLVTGNSNLGLLMVTLADRASPDLIAFFVLGQIPMYFLPVLALPVYRRIVRG